MLEIINPGSVLMGGTESMMRLLEEAGRTCYKSEERIGPGTADKFIRSIVKRGHESVLEHATLTFKIICDRSCSHQLVRHRIAAYSQESQRYCNYGKAGHLKIICPPKIAPLPAGVYAPLKGCWGVTLEGGTETKLDRVVSTELAIRVEKWLWVIAQAFKIYKGFLDQGIPPEDARSVLPNATKTEVVSTFNLRQWRHVFKDRALNPKAQWQIREIMLGILDRCVRIVPAVFEDLVEKP